VIIGLLSIVFIRTVLCYNLLEFFINFVNGKFPNISLNLIHSLSYSSLALFLRLGLKGLIEDLITIFNMPLFLGMDNPSDNTGISDKGSEEPTYKRPKYSSSGGKSVGDNSADSAENYYNNKSDSESEVKVPVSSDYEAKAPVNSDSNNTASNPGVQDVSERLNSLSVKNEKPAPGVTYGAHKLDSVYDRQIERLSAQLSALNVKLSKATDESSIEDIRNTIDSTHDQLAFVQEAKLDSIRKMQKASSSYSVNKSLSESSTSSKRTHE